VGSRTGKLQPLSISCSKIDWPISDLAHLVHLMDPDIEPDLMSDEANVPVVMKSLGELDENGNKIAVLGHTKFESHTGSSAVFEMSEMLETTSSREVPSPHVCLALCSALASGSSSSKHKHKRRSCCWKSNTPALLQKLQMLCLA
jgi:hypothetical protein